MYLNITTVIKETGVKNTSIKKWAEEGFVKTETLGKRTLYCVSDILVCKNKPELQILPKKKGKDFGPIKIKAVKCSLEKIIKDKSDLIKINEIVLISNQVTIHTYQFVKLYYLYCHDNNIPLPKMDRKFVLTVMKLFITTTKTLSKTPSELQLNMQKVYEKYYKNTQKDKIVLEYLSNILNYLADEFVTMFKNNIIANYFNYIKKFIKANWKPYEDEIKSLYNEKNITKEECNLKLNEHKSQIKKIFKDFVEIKTSDEILVSNQRYHVFINTQKPFIIPNKVFEKNSLYYDIKVSPSDYLKNMVYMMKDLERKNLKMDNVFPLRNQIIPKHIKIDTQTLINIFWKAEFGKKQDFSDLDNNERQKQIWPLFFKTERKIFNFNKKGYKFHYLIETDGVGCSILLSKKIEKNLGNNKIKEKYIQDLTDSELISLKDKTLVGIDPGLSDLLFACKEKNKNNKPIVFRYTQNQRRVETKIKKHRKELHAHKTKEKIKGKTIQEWESELSIFNKKTLNLDLYVPYLEKKNEINSIISKFYHKNLYRVHKLHKYSANQRSEAKMINKFKEMFGPPEKTVIGIGDYEQFKHMKFLEPVKGKGFREVFRKAGYEIYLIDEFRTSMMCSFCQDKDDCCEKFRKREHRKYLCHGLLRCKTCKRMWNRDLNASINIKRILENEILGAINSVNKDERRPLYLKRQPKILKVVTKIIKPKKSSIRKKSIKTSCKPATPVIGLNKVSKTKLSCQLDI